jgi:hypothetical protein
MGGLCYEYSFCNFLKKIDQNPHINTDLATTRSPSFKTKIVQNEEFPCEYMNSFYKKV